MSNIIDPTQDWLDSLPPDGRIKRHLHQLWRLKARLALMEERGVVALREGIFPVYKSDTQKMIKLLEEEIREELTEHYPHLLEKVFGPGKARAA